MALNSGVLEVTYEEVDLSGGITNAGNEPWDPEANSELDEVESVSIVGQTDAGVNIAWDHANGGRFLVTYGDYDAATDGKLTDASAGTAAGKVRVRLEGRR